MIDAGRSEARLTVRTAVADRALAVTCAALLSLDAVVHATDAGFYDVNTGALLSEGTLFRVEAGAAALAALALLVLPRRFVWLAALAVAAAAVAAVVLSTYVDLGVLGPLPDLYEPTWASPGKVSSVFAEGLAVATGPVGLVGSYRT